MQKKFLPAIGLLIFLFAFESKDVVAKSKILDVPYKVQPNEKTCQSTCLKMLSMYFNVPGKEENIENIYDKVNKSPKRPDKTPCTVKNGDERCVNAWENIVWWWNSEAIVNTSQIRMKNSTTRDPIEAIEKIVENIDADKPLMMSVTNKNARAGHLVLVIGYTEYLPNQSNPNFKLICHDPYGRFFPELTSELHGEKRYDYGYSKMDGSEFGPGAGVEISIESLKKFNKDSDDNDYYAIFTLK